MKVFISWSGERSKKIAEFLRDWIMEVIQATEAWISVDITKGSRWNEEISKALSESKVGIICLDKDSLDSNWVHFEAGAIAKTSDAMVCTLLLDIKNTDVKPPLSTFQSTNFKKDDVRKLMQDINKRLEKNGNKSLQEQVLDKLFDKNWEDLDKSVQEVLKLKARNKTERSEKEILEELLEISRDIQQNTSKQTVFMSNDWMENDYTKVLYPKNILANTSAYFPQFPKFKPLTDKSNLGETKDKE